MEALARKNYQMMLNAVASKGARVVAEACGVDEATVSRRKSQTEKGEPGQWEATCIALAALGLKIVPADALTVERDELAALVTFSRKRINGLTLDDLVMYSDDGGCDDVR